jgi:UDPglucose 6-dehydrogenase
MSLVSAEIAKISLNSYVTMKISFANTLASICADTPGADVDAITRALGADRRVSPYGLRGGLPFGGPCFPRDNRAFSAFAAGRGVAALLAQATDHVNHMQLRRLVEMINNQIDIVGESTVSVLGMAYKANTPVIEESPSVALVESLLQRGVAVTAYDPLAADNVRQRFGHSVYLASSMREAIRRSAIIVLAVPMPEFADLDAGHFTHRRPVIVDCWRVLDPARFPKPATYLGLGVPPS